MPELNKEQKLSRLKIELKEKNKTLKAYQKAIKEGNKTIKEIMNQLNAELKTAEKIHRALLPSSLPVIPDCEFSFKFIPSTTASGGKDFYEITPRPLYKQFSITMSSCDSYTLSALLMSARLKMLNSINIRRADIKSFTKNLAEETNIKRKKNSSTAFTPAGADIFHGIVDRKTYEMSYALTGNIMVFYLRNNTLHSLKKSAVNTFKTTLDRGDLLIVCSPGVLQAKNRQGKTLSLSDFKKLLKTGSSEMPVHEFRNYIVYSLQEFSKGCHISRDQSILVMKIKKNILKLAAVR